MCTKAASRRATGVGGVQDPRTSRKTILWRSTARPVKKPPTGWTNSTNSTSSRQIPQASLQASRKATPNFFAFAFNRLRKVPRGLPIRSCHCEVKKGRCADFGSVPYEGRFLGRLSCPRPGFSARLAAIWHPEPFRKACLAITTVVRTGIGDEVGRPRIWPGSPSSASCSVGGGRAATVYLPDFRR